MILHKKHSQPDRMWLGRGTQGQTVQEIVAERRDDHVRLTVSRIGGEPVEVDLGPAEVQALADWLTDGLAPVPHDQEED